ncbi:MAG TPA: POTRA domain-containing protein, partial [Terriglobales bacterium]|nr:POTRA domain-containing protein [Terriglobales bacterium]
MAGVRGALLGVLSMMCLLAAPVLPARGQASSPSVPGDEGPPLGTSGSYQGARVREIQFRGVSERDAEPLRRLLTQKAGEPLDRFKIAQSIRALYGSGRFADIEVEAERLSASEASLVFVVRQNYFVGPIHVSGQPKGTPTVNQMISALKLQLGEQFTEGKMKQGLAALQGLFRADGLYRAQITPAYTYHDDTQVIDIVLQMTPGPRARVGTVTVEGDAGFTATQLADIGKLHPGDEVTSARVRRALARVRKQYGNLDRLEAQVTLVTPPFYHPESETVDYTFRIDRGPEVMVETQGVKMRKGLIKRYVPVYEEGAVDQDLLNEGKRNLRDYFQGQGYFHAQVEVSSEMLDGGKRQSVVYVVDKGPRHTLKQLVIEGNHYFDYDTLRERMLLQPASWYMLHGRFSQALLSHDVDTIESLYQANGFQQVKVTPEVDDDY